MRSFNIPLGSSGEYLELQIDLLENRFYYKGERKRKEVWRSLSGWFRVQAGNGEVYEVRYRPRLFDNLPVVSVNGVRVKYEPPIPWWSYPASGLMILLPVIISIWLSLRLSLSFIRTYSPDDYSFLCCSMPCTIALGLPILSWATLATRSIDGRKKRAIAFQFVLLVLHVVVLAASTAITVFLLMFLAAV